MTTPPWATAAAQSNVGGLSGPPTLQQRPGFPEPADPSTAQNVDNADPHYLAALLGRVLARLAALEGGSGSRIDAGLVNGDTGAVLGGCALVAVARVDVGHYTLTLPTAIDWETRICLITPMEGPVFGHATPDGVSPDTVIDVRIYNTQEVGGDPSDAEFQFEISRL